MWNPLPQTWPRTFWLSGIWSWYPRSFQTMAPRVWSFIRFYTGVTISQNSRYYLSLLLLIILKIFFLFLLWTHSAWKGCHGHCVCFITVDQESIILIITFPDFLLRFSGGSDGRESVCNTRAPGSILGLGRSPGEGNGNPLQDACLENYMDKGACWATVHWVSQSDMTERLTYTTMYQSGCLSVVLPIKCCQTFALLPSDRWEVIPT